MLNAVLNLNWMGIEQWLGLGVVIGLSQVHTLHENQYRCNGLPYGPGYYFNWDCICHVSDRLHIHQADNRWHLNKMNNKPKKDTETCSNWNIWQQYQFEEYTHRSSSKGLTWNKKNHQYLLSIILVRLNKEHHLFLEFSSCGRQCKINNDNLKIFYDWGYNSWILHYLLS